MGCGKSGEIEKVGNQDSEDDFPSFGLKIEGWRGRGGKKEDEVEDGRK